MAYVGREDKAQKDLIYRCIRGRLSHAAPTGNPPKVALTRGPLSSNTPSTHRDTLHCLPTHQILPCMMHAKDPEVEKRLSLEAATKMQARPTLTSRTKMIVLEPASSISYIMSILPFSSYLHTSGQAFYLPNPRPNSRGLPNHDLYWPQASSAITRSVSSALLQHHQSLLHFCSSSCPAHHIQ